MTINCCKNSVSLINNLSGKYSKSKTSFCEIRYLRDEAYHILCYDRRNVSGSVLKSELSFAGGWPGQSTFHLGTIGIAMKEAPSTLVVCMEGEGALVAVKWEPCQFQHQYLQCGAPVYPLRE